VKNLCQQEINHFFRSKIRREGEETGLLKVTIIIKSIKTYESTPQCHPRNYSSPFRLSPVPITRKTLRSISRTYNNTNANCRCLHLRCTIISQNNHLLARTNMELFKMDWRRNQII